MDSAPAIVATEKPAAGYRVPPRFGAVSWIGFGALFKRELTKYLRSSADILLGTSFVCLLYLVVFSLALGGAGGDENLVLFIAPGLVMFAVIESASINPPVSMIIDKTLGAFADTLMAPLKPLEIVLAYVVAGAIAGIITGALVATGAVLLGKLNVADPLAAFAFAAGCAFMLASFGFLVGIVVTKWEGFGVFYSLTLLPLTFLSGVFAPVDRLPEILRFLVLLNPFTYAIDGFRAACGGTAAFSPALSAAIIAGASVAALILAERLVDKGWRLKP
jgi:ABC-2 type transport system permease protein